MEEHMSIKEKILVIAAHPDDELLGGGATFAKRIQQGFDVHALVVCEGQSIRYDSQEKDIDLLTVPVRDSNNLAKSIIDILNHSNVPNVESAYKKVKEKINMVYHSKNLEFLYHRIL